MKSMESLRIEYADRAAAGRAVDRIWRHKGFAGEVELEPLKGGRWLLRVDAERHVPKAWTDALLALGGRPLSDQAGGPGEGGAADDGAAGGGAGEGQDPLPAPGGRRRVGRRR